MIDYEKSGAFTLPGEAGHEELTLRLAKKWGADVIRDSDGTKLSDEILDAGYGIYSTLCLIRCDNEWAKKNTDKLQQNFLMSMPVVARSSQTVIELLSGYSKQQFKVNFADDPIEFWQVFDRTENVEVSADNWSYDDKNGTVTIKNTIPYHTYTVNFLAVRLWEEISMYNHITNDWGDKEHLMAVEPCYPEVREHLLEWLENWCIEHPATDVVRFTSMFYNFTWIWTDSDKMRDNYTDWASYDFTVNPIALREFEKEYGYKMTSEDFINRGMHNSTHNAPTQKYLDWMDFINKFVSDFGKQCIDVVHKYGKKAYVFYDDSWVGVEPYGERFAEMGFDGIIKCVFNAFETRLCSHVKGVDTHEIRLHPYLFPTGLGGLPTFSEGGDPKKDAEEYWMRIRRALLRAPIDRIGLGGYLSLTENYPDFQDYIESLANEFRLVKALHENGTPDSMPINVAIITAWGRIRSWSCSGHMHEHPDLDLIHIIEALSGLPVNVEFMSVSDIATNGVPENVHVIINAGLKGSAWSGGDAWKSADAVSAVTRFVDDGGIFIGVNEPTATDDGISFLKLSNLFGVDIEKGLRICCGRYPFESKQCFENAKFAIPSKSGVYLPCDGAEVIMERDGEPLLTVNNFGKGKAVYLSGFRYSAESARMLLELICLCNRCDVDAYVCNNSNIEIAFFKSCNAYVVANSSSKAQTGEIVLRNGSKITVMLDATEMKLIEL